MGDKNKGSGIKVLSDSAPCRTQSLSPVEYRLARKKDGSIILQGAFEWRDGSRHGILWDEVPIHELEE